MGSFIVILIASVSSGVLAGLIAFLITYNEFSHHYPSKKEPIRIAFRTALGSFLFFLLLVSLALTAVHLYLK